MLVSQGPSGAKANAGSFDPAISADGRFVAFTSAATNFDPADTDSAFDVYVRDLDSGTMTLVSRASGAEGDDADVEAGSPSISANGRYVAFVSGATNLVPGLPEARSQVFVRDLVTQTTSLVSRSAGAEGAPGPGFSGEPSISADGRLVAFESTGITGAGQGSGQSIYIRDLAAQTTTLISRASGPDGEPGNDYSQRPLISANGERVAFTSFASNLAPGHPGPSEEDVSAYVRDLSSNETSLEARASDGTPGNRDADAMAISANGERFAFSSISTNLVERETASPYAHFFSRDLRSGKTKIVSRGLPAPSRLRRGDPGAFAAAASGRRLVFAYTFQKEDLRGEREHVFRHDLRSGETERISVLTKRVHAPIDEFELALSADGRDLALRTTKRLHPDDTNDALDVYLVRLPR